MIYLSGSITGTRDYLARFKAAQDFLESRGHSVINPALVNSNLPESCTHDGYMVVSMATLSLCDSIYLLNGWECSVGAKEEVAYAINRGYKIVLESTFYEEYPERLKGGDITLNE